jgi:hypothetical protein
MFSYSVEFKGLDEQLAKFNGADALIDRELTSAMQSAVLDVEAAVKPLVPVGVSGRLRNSIGSRVTREGVGSIVGKIGSDLAEEAYPAAMESGARAHFPPPANLERWVHLKLGVPTEDALGVAYLVARKISQSGLKGRYYMKKGYQAAQRKVLDRFTKALANIAQGLSNGRS